MGKVLVGFDDGTIGQVSCVLSQSKRPTFKRLVEGGSVLTVRERHKKSNSKFKFCYNHSPKEMRTESMVSALICLQEYCEIYNFERHYGKSKRAVKYQPSFGRQQ